ncbi:hypothetical protein PFICI_05528 [Pestalotiopsis fici W106-1]|uniref:Alcohol acetyltransferase n=1 Tax=Pestalotiopsis fici (strain W106-1 / CGMCC3.15140) TaxID=1229662 RepID=W3XE01_PESFW|nr:uncharacterized protein PFICI_05528 [Pestalotiopsis fici W106-1]ETS83652.1 hypothetical protein PFICI_05528 [Pestalotiopsis fici W106-1]
MLRVQSLQTQVDSKFEDISIQPGWRVIVMHVLGAEFIEVLYVWNHPHHDGTSGKFFHQHLARNLNESLAQDKESVLETTKGSDSLILDLSDPSDKLAPNPELLSWWLVAPKFLFKALWKELKPPSIFPPEDTYATWAPIKHKPFTTRFRTFSVSHEVATNLVRACRLHHTTVTGLVQALALVSLARSLGDMKGFASRTPYDLRHILPPNPPRYPWLQPKETMCNYVSVVDHEFDAKLVASIRSKRPPRTDENASLPSEIMDTVWSVAARVRQEIRARLDSGLFNDSIGIMKFVSDWRAQQQGEMQKARYFSWLVTNLGVLDRNVGRAQEQEEGWSLRKAELVLSTEILSAAISVIIMTVKDEQMCVTCSWQDCVVEADIGERLLGDLERWINEIGS